jgi:hypothetical protein
VRGSNPQYKAPATLLLRDLTKATSHCYDISESSSCEMECRLGYRPVGNIGAQWTCVFDFMRYGDQEAYDSNEKTYKKCSDDPCVEYGPPDGIGEYLQALGGPTYREGAQYDPIDDGKTLVRSDAK